MKNSAPAALSGRRVVVTGASGLVAQDLVPLLLANGAEVVSIYRRRPPWYQDLAEESRHTECRVDLRLDPLPAEAMEGATDVVHMAAVLFATRDAVLHRDNSLITDTVAEAVARSTQIRRLIFISSLAARGPGAGTMDDTSVQASCAPMSAYGRSKAHCEAVMRSARPENAPVLILRPPVVLSLRDARMMRLFGLIRRFPSLIAPHLPRRFSAIMCEDLARAILVALRVQRALEGTFDVQHASEIDLSRLLAKPTRNAGPIAKFAAEGLVRCFTLWADLAQTQPLITRDKLREARCDAWIGDPTAFTNESGWSASRSPVAFLRETLRRG